IEDRDRKSQPTRSAETLATINTALAKKARTPLPPRPVQAPKRRDTKKPRSVTALGGQGRPPWLLYGLAALGPVALAVVLLVIFVGGNGSSTKNVTGSAPKIHYAPPPGPPKGEGAARA